MSVPTSASPSPRVARCSGRTPLHAAVAGDRPELVRLLLTAGGGAAAAAAATSSKGGPGGAGGAWVEWADGADDTPLVLAARCAGEAAAAALLEAGARLQHVYGERGRVGGAGKRD